MTVDRDGTTVRVHLSAVGFTFAFTWNAGTEWAATLLDEKLRTLCGDHLESLRRRYYHLGYTDGRGKRPKCQWFPRGWKHTEDGPPR